MVFVKYVKYVHLVMIVTNVGYWALNLCIGKPAITHIFKCTADVSPCSKQPHTVTVKLACLNGVPSFKGAANSITHEMFTHTHTHRYKYQ